MKFKKYLLAAAFLMSMVTFGFSNSTKELPTEVKEKASITQIKAMIQKIDLDYKSLDGQKVNIHFMINSDNELIILKTDSELVDRALKFNLNYKTVDNKDLMVNQEYILPLQFEQR